MKPKSVSSPFAKALLVAFTLTSVPSAHSATFNWDSLITGAAGGGSSTTEATEWKTSGAGNVWWDGVNNVAWTNGNDAAFTGTAGNVRLGGSNATITVGTLSFGVAGYTIDLKDFTDNTANNLTVTGISGSTATITNTSGTTRNFTLNNSTDQTWSGTIASQRVNFIKQGVGKFAFSGALPGAFGGTSVDIQAGELEFSGAISDNSNMGINVANNATLDLAGNGVGLRVISSAASGSVTNSGATATIKGLYGGAALNLQGTVTGNVRFQIRDGNVLTLAGNNSFSGGVTLGNASLFNTTNTTINVDHNNGLGTGLVDLSSVAGGANGALTLNLRTAAPIVGGLEGQNTSAKNVVLGATGVNTTMEVGSLNTNTTFNGVIKNATGQVGSLTKVGTGSLTLSGANTYTGTTTIKNGSIIIGGGNDRLATTGSVVLGDGSTSGKLVLGDGTARNQTLAGLTTTGNGGSVVGGAAADSTLNLSIASGTNSFGGVLGGTGTNENKLALTKSGSGTLTLTNTNTYTGATTVSSGTLLINGSLGNSTTTVNGGTLGGTGTIGGAVTIDSGAFLAPGASIESLGVASADINGSLVIEYDGTGPGTIDLLAVTGLLDIAGSTVDFNLFGTALDDPYYIFATYGSLSGTFNTITDLPTGYGIQYAHLGNNIALVAIPEPNAAALIGGFGILALLRRRRR